MENNVTYYSFLSQIKGFLRAILKDPVNCKIDDFFIQNNISKSKLLNLLKRYNIIEVSEKVDDSNKFKIKYSIPRKNFERKIKRLYSRLFEVNLPTKENIDEDGESGVCGATTASAVNDTAPILPMGGINRRRIYLTNEQLTNLREALTTFNAGNYQYDVPFMFKDADGKKDDCYIHNKKGGISADRLK